MAEPPRAPIGGVLITVGTHEVAIATGEVRERSFSLRLRNFKFGVH